MEGEELVRESRRKSAYCNAKIRTINIRSGLGLAILFCFVGAESVEPSRFEFWDCFIVCSPPLDANEIKLAQLTQQSIQFNWFIPPLNVRYEGKGDGRPDRQAPTDRAQPKTKITKPK